MPVMQQAAQPPQQKQQQQMAATYNRAPAPQKNNAALAATMTASNPTSSSTYPHRVGNMDGFSGETFSRQQHLVPQPRKTRAQVEYQRVAMDQLWKGVRSTYGVDRNFSVSTQQALAWESRRAIGEELKEIRPTELIEAERVAKKVSIRPASAIVQPTAAAQSPNPLRSYSKQSQESSHYEFTKQNIFGSDNVGSPKRVRPASAIVSPSHYNAVPQHSHWQAPASMFSSRPSSSYEVRKVARGVDGLPEKIGSFPPPTPADPDGLHWFRDNSYTTDLSFYKSMNRMGPGQVPNTSLGVHASAEDRVAHERALRDPAMDDPLFSSFSADRVFHDWTTVVPPAPFRCKDSIPIPLPNGSYAKPDKLFLQRLKKDATRKKDDMRIKTSARSAEEAQRRSDESLEYITVLEDEDKKRRRKEKLEKAEELKRRQMKRWEATLSKRSSSSSLSRLHSGRTESPTNGRTGENFDLQQYMKAGARTPDNNSPVRSRSPTSNSPTRSRSPTSKMFQRAETASPQQQQGQVHRAEQAPSHVEHRFSNSALSFVHSPFASSDSAHQSSTTANASAAMRQTILHARAADSVLNAFSKLKAKELA